MENIIINEPSILFRVNKSFDKNMSSTDLYNYTRGRWKINLEKAKNAKLAFAIYQGEIIEVYNIQSWHPAGSTLPARRSIDKKELNTLESLKNRHEFVGKCANEEIRTKYVKKNVFHLFNQLSSAPFVYLNVK